jgi:hypothetical protein
LAGIIGNEFPRLNTCLAVSLESSSTFPGAAASSPIRSTGLGTVGTVGLKGVV